MDGRGRKLKLERKFARMNECSLREVNKGVKCAMSDMIHWKCSNRCVMSCFVFTYGESQQINRPPMSLRLFGGRLSLSKLPPKELRAP